MKCASCGKEIKFLRTKNGKSMPVNMETIQGNETMYNPKKGHMIHSNPCRKLNGK